MVSDPRALHHIVVKDQDIYHETDMFLMYVSCDRIFLYAFAQPQCRTNKLIFGEGLIATVG